MIILALGSNMGDREATMLAALIELEAAGVKTVAKSTFLETPALLPKGAPPAWDMPYLNMVAVVQTSHAPQALLEITQGVELQLGRTKRGHWGPREIDIDLLAYHKEVLESDTLNLPHPHMPYRRFVLAPLVEIAPDWKHPVLNKSSTEMLKELVR